MMRLLNLTIAVTIAFLSSTMLAPASGFAGEAPGEGSHPERVQSLDHRSHAPLGGLVGTWDTEVTIRDCPSGAVIRTFDSIGSFMSGGTMIDSTSGTPQALKTPGHGVWRHLSGRTYRFSFKAFTFDPAGNPTGWSTITHAATMEPGGDAYASEGIAEFYAPNGVLLFTGCSSTTATRFE